MSYDVHTTLLAKLPSTVAGGVGHMHDCAALVQPLMQGNAHAATTEAGKLKYSHSIVVSIAQVFCHVHVELARCTQYQKD